ncbi:beta-xylosidase [Paraburkholderia phytofirmans]|uniref:beta-xylosidase n=1 Tax=Paraburkholderia phytofirmans TaxID=261302 RepID=UPI0038BD1BB5
MTHPLFMFSSAGTMYGVVKRRAAVGAVSLALGGALLLVSSHGVAQITQGSGSSQQESRTSSMGSAPDSSASAVHESQKPQTKDGGSANTRGKTGGKGHKPQGAGGFDNGLYGTGAGSNK